MGVWPGLGVNYAGNQASWSDDLAYFQKIGLNNIRPHMTGIPIPWSAGTPQVGTTQADIHAYWRLLAQTCHAAGFYVTWGPAFPPGIGPYGGGGLTLTLWNSYRTAVLAEAAYLQAQGIIFGDFELGNELEAYVDNVTITAAQCRANIRQLATDVKAVYNLSPISYGTANGQSSGWIADGLGDLDSISIHPYGSVQTSANYKYPALGQFGGDAQSMIDEFGGDCYISEFHLDSSNADILTLSTEQAVTQMRKLLDIIKDSGVSKAFVFEWCGYLYVNNDFAMKNNDGSYNPVWDVLFTDNGRRTFVP